MTMSPRWGVTMLLIVTAFGCSGPHSHGVKDKSPLQGASASASIGVTVRIAGLVAFAPTLDGVNLWAFFPNTDSPANLPANCQPAAASHAAALRVSPQFLQPGTVKWPVTDFVVIPLHGEEVRLDTSALTCTTAGSLDLSQVPQINQLSSTLGSVRKEFVAEDASKIQPSDLAGRVRLAPSSITFGDPTLDSNQNPVTWDFTTDQSKTVSYTTLAQMATSLQTCTGDPSVAVPLNLVGAQGTRTIMLYPKLVNSAYVLNLDAVNLLPSDQFTALPIMPIPSRTVPHFWYLYFASEDAMQSYAGQCPQPTAEKIANVSGKPYCPFAYFAP